MSSVNVGEHIREMREQKSLSQRDVETRTGLLRTYISRVENGYTVPSIETLEKIARAFDVPLWQLFYEGNAKPSPPVAFKPKNELVWGSSGKEARLLGAVPPVLETLGRRRTRTTLAFGSQDGTPVSGAVIQGREPGVLRCQGGIYLSSIPSLCSISTSKR